MPASISSRFAPSKPGDQLRQMNPAQPITDQQGRPTVGTLPPNVAGASTRGGQTIQAAPPPSVTAQGGPPPAAPNLGPAPPVPNFQPPMPLEGKPVAEQAKLLGDFLKKYGVNAGPLTVGGTSPYDTQINTLIAKANDPNISEAERAAIANQLVPLIQGRGQGVPGAQFKYDYQTGSYTTLGPGGKPATPSGPTGQPAAPGTQPYAPLPSVQVGGDTIGPAPTLSPTSEYGDAGGYTEPAMGNYDDIVDMILQLWEGDNQSARTSAEESQFIEGQQAGQANRKSLLADKLAASGIFGGKSVNALVGLDRDNELARSQGTADIRIAGMERESEDKRLALQQSLELAGLTSQEAQAAAELLLEQEKLQLDRETTSAELGLAGRGQDLDREAELGRQTLTGRGQDIDRELGYRRDDTDRYGIDTSAETTRRGQDINYDLGRSSLEDSTRRTDIASGQLDLARELGIGELDLKRELGRAGVDLDYLQTELDRIGQNASNDLQREQLQAQFILELVNTLVESGQADQTLIQRLLDMTDNA